jgi:RNA polymerase sigma-70 factor, ECF subfamily
MSAGPCSDIDLLDAWRHGDEGAGSVLFGRHYAAIARFFHNKAPEAAEDLVQQTFLACVEGSERFRGDASVRTLLFAIAHNQLRNHYRRRRRQPETDDLFDECSRSLSPGPTTLIAKAQEERLLLEALRLIPLAYQIVLEFHYWEQLDAQAIAEITGVPLGTAKTRIRRGRQLLEQAMSEIAESRNVLESTLSNLEDWARGLRAHSGA